MAEETGLSEYPVTLASHSFPTGWLANIRATRQESGAPFRDLRAVRGLMFGMVTPLVLIIGTKYQVD